MVVFPLAPDQTIAQMWSNGARGGGRNRWFPICGPLTPTLYLARDIEPQIFQGHDLDSLGSP